MLEILAAIPVNFATLGLRCLCNRRIFFVYFSSEVSTITMNSAHGSAESIFYDAEEPCNFLFNTVVLTRQKPVFRQVPCATLDSGSHPDGNLAGELQGISDCSRPEYLFRGETDK